MQAAANTQEPTTTKRYVLMLYTGGTIGMKPESGGGGLSPSGALVDQVNIDPWLNDPSYAKDIPPEDKKRVSISSSIKGPFATKVTEDLVQIVYGILTFDRLLDSSDMNPKGWTKMAEHIQKYYDKFDGFVILHGTDTMAYTSSALAFMLQGIQKPVVITGSQVPLFQLRTDAEENLKGALIMAAKDIPEVTLFFYNKLLRGCRAVKVNASGFEAFESPNFEPLAEVGVNVTVRESSIFRQSGPLFIHKNISRDVGAIRIFPGITKETVEGFLSNLKGAVLESFGAGNVPNDIVGSLKKAIKERQILIVNVTQCLEGTVDDSIYASGEQLIKIGVVPGADMTSEAALTKLAFLLSDKSLSYDKRKELLQRNIRGELTPTI